MQQTKLTSDSHQESDSWITRNLRRVKRQWNWGSWLGDSETTTTTTETTVTSQENDSFTQQQSEFSRSQEKVFDSSSTENASVEGIIEQNSIDPRKTSASREKRASGEDTPVIDDDDGAEDEGAVTETVSVAIK